MRQHFIRIDGAGEIVGAGFGFPEETDIIVDDAMTVVELSRLYVDGENGLTPRPQVDMPTFESGVLTVPVYPDGTVVCIIDTQDDTHLYREAFAGLTEPLTFTFPDAGFYVVSIEPPTPYMSRELRFKQ